MDLTQYLATAEAVARDAGRRIREYYARDLEVEVKGTDARDLVTAADRDADDLIVDRLGRAFPDSTFYTEESVKPGDAIDPAVPTWIVDPLDGTSNFAHHLPVFAVSIGLWWRHRPRVGIVHDVMRGHAFTAIAGCGAWLDGERLRVTKHASIRGGIFAADWARTPARRDAAFSVFKSIGMEAHTMRSLGCASLGFCAVAAGWLEGYFNLGLWPWDAAAGLLIVEEAGGTCTDEAGRPWSVSARSAIVSNGPVHAELLQAVQAHLPASE